MRPVDRDAFLSPPMGTAAAAGRLDTGRHSSTPRPGWYGYQVRGMVELPSWAVELALTVERPVGSGFGGRWLPPPRSWVDEPVGPVAPEPELSPRGPAQAMVLLRAPGRLQWLDGIGEAVAEIETVAGVRRTDPDDDLLEDTGGRRGPRLLAGPALPGLTPVRAAVAREQLQLAGSRGLPAPLRRRRPAGGGGDVAWRAGAGCVLACDGPDGRSAQAVVGLRGTGDPAAITPPPGGALVLRAWRVGAACGVACGLVLGAPTALGLGREAQRVAAAARGEGWDASVLSGSAAVLLARAASPHRPAPQEVAVAATRTQVATLFESCLIATGITAALQRQASGGA